LLTLAMATFADAASWTVARDVSAPITLHVNGAGFAPADGVRHEVGLHVHPLQQPDGRRMAAHRVHRRTRLDRRADRDGNGHGVPPFQQALAHGIRPSLSVDVETEMPGELFTQMRSAMTLQRMQVLARERAGEKNLPKLLTVKEVVEFATIEGAKTNALDAKIGTLAPGKSGGHHHAPPRSRQRAALNNAYSAVVQGMARATWTRSSSAAR